MRAPRDVSGDASLDSAACMLLLFNALNDALLPVVENAMIAAAAERIDGDDGSAGEVVEFASLGAFDLESNVS